MKNVYQLKYGVHGQKQIIGQKGLVTKKLHSELNALNKKGAINEIKFRDAHQLTLVRIDVQTGKETVVEKYKHDLRTDKFNVVSTK